METIPFRAASCEGWAPVCCAKADVERARPAAAMMKDFIGVAPDMGGPAIPCRVQRTIVGGPAVPCRARATIVPRPSPSASPASSALKKAFLNAEGAQDAEGDEDGGAAPVQPPRPRGR